MNFKVEILFPGFCGQMAHGMLGWGSWALIQTPDKKNILFDTGGPAVRGFVLNNLAKHDLKPEDIDAVVISHLHWDHICNVDFFPQAEFYLAKKEWDYACDLVNRDRWIDEKVITYLRTFKLHLLEDGDHEIMPGMTTIMTPGHTPGSMSLVLDQGEEGKWVLAGDAVKHRKELSTLQVHMSKDPESTDRSIRRVRAMASRVLPGHDCWLTVKDGEVIPESSNDLVIRYGQGITVNGGETEIVIKMD